MKKGTIIIIAIVAIIVILAGYGISKNNGFVKLREDVNAASSNIDVALERRADLIPNLVNTVKGYASHEQSVIDSITTARENLLKASTIEEKATANNELSTALNALAVVVENYPDLKANENFINLQDELAGTENRIAVVRKDYNDIATKYNKAIQVFPGSLIAKIGNFEKVAYFEADEAKKDVPEVNFN